MAKIKKGSIVIPKIGVHKGEKHTVIHDFGNGTYNIQPMGFRNKYHLGAAGAKASDLKLVKEDKDIGHQDDEPNMLKSTALEIMEYGKKLMDKLDKYDDMEEEVDFPNWWQSKLIISKEYLQKAYHYLDSEEKTKEDKVDESTETDELKVLLRDLIQKEMEERAVVSKIPSAYGYDEDVAGISVNGSDVEESTKEYGKSLKKIALDKQLKMLSKKDKETLLKIAKLMGKEKLKEVIEKANKLNEANKYPTVSNKFKNALDRLPEKHFHRKGVKALIKKLKEKDPEAAMAYTMAAFGWMKNMKEGFASYAQQKAAYASGYKGKGKKKRKKESMASHPVVKQGFAIGKASSVGGEEMSSASGISDSDEDPTDKHSKKVKEIVKAELKKAGLEDDYNILDVITSLGLENTNESKFIKVVREEINKQLEL